MTLCVDIFAEMLQNPHYSDKERYSSKRDEAEVFQFTAALLPLLTGIIVQ